MAGKSPLLKALYNMDGSLPMHMPGHKRNPFWGPVTAGFAGRRIYDFDYTEVPGLDDLHAPEGVIGEAQALAAECFRSRHTFFLVNGASAGMAAAVMACCGEGDKVLVPRNAHRCVYEGLVLSGAYPVYFQPDYNPQLAVPLSPSRQQVVDLMAREDLQALILVHPTYHGAGCDLDLIREARENNLITIVDEAHGSHFIFDSRLPMSALEAGADIVIHSTHKTLGSMTQTGLLHLGTEKPDPEGVKNVLSLLQSTSPSYVLMASLDAMRADLDDQGEALVGNTVDLAMEFREAVEGIPGFFCGDLGNKYGYDPTKILLQSSLMTGFELGEILRRDYGIYAELEEDSFILLMVTVGDTEAGMKRLLEALEDISFRWESIRSEAHVPVTSMAKDTGKDIYSTIPKVVVSPRQAFGSPKKKCKLRESVGRTSGSLIVPYPPGVPLLCPGERISEEIVEYLYFIKANKAHVQGLGCSDDFELLVLEC